MVTAKYEKMKKSMKITALKCIISASILLLLSPGCFDDRKILFDHQLLEWEPLNRATNALSTNIDLEADETDNRTVNLRIQYAGAHVDHSLTAAYEVYAPETTATEGEHFQILGDKILEVPANSSVSTPLELEILSGAIMPGDSYTIVLRITEDSDVPPMENYKDFTINISK